MRVHANKTKTMLGHECYEPVSDGVPYKYWVLDDIEFKELWQTKKTLAEAKKQISANKEKYNELVGKYNALLNDYNVAYKALEEYAKNINEVEQIKQETEAVKQTKKQVIELFREKANKERNIKNKKEDPGYIVKSSSQIWYKCGKDAVLMWKTFVQTPFLVYFSKESFKEYFNEDQYRREYFNKIGIGEELELKAISKYEIENNRGNYYIDSLVTKNFNTGYYEIALIHYNEVTL